MRIYVTARYKGDQNKADINKLCGFVREAGWEDFCFVRDVENYQKMFKQPDELMRRSLEEIIASNALLLDLGDNPSSGRIVEAGIAYALGKMVIMLKQPNTVVSDAVLGIASIVITYNEHKDIIAELHKAIVAE
jgi:nucleoside 2-deoxyribosyltransferase